jgi:ribosomal protein L35AE/L33A
MTDNDNDEIVIEYKGRNYSADKDILLKEIEEIRGWPNVVKHLLAEKRGYKRFDFGVTDEDLAEFKDTKKKAPAKKKKKAPAKKKKKAPAKKKKKAPAKKKKDLETIRIKILSYRRNKRLQTTNQAIAQVIDDYNHKALVGKEITIGFPNTDSTAKAKVVDTHGQDKNRKLRIRFTNKGMTGYAFNQVAEVEV